MTPSEPRRRRAGEPADPPRRVRGDDPDPAAGRAAHLPAGGRRRQPLARHAQRARGAQGVQPRPRQDPHRRRPDRRAVDPDHRRLQVPPPVPAGEPLRARGRLSVVRQPRGQQRRRGVVQRRAHRPGRQLATPEPRQRAQREIGDQRRRAVAHRVCAAAAAEQALGGQRGSVVALDVQTGAVLAMYSNPTFNPNGLSVHDTQYVQNTFNQINSGDKAALQRAYRDRYPPGSTFKVVTTQVGASRPAPRRRTTHVRLRPNGFQIPGTQTRRCGNFGDEVVRRHARGQLDRIVQRDVRGARLPAWATRSPPAMDQCGIDSTPPIDLDAERGGERRAAGRRRQAALRARRDRPGRRVHVTAPDGAHRRGHRQQRRDQGTARGQGDPQQRRQDRAHHRLEGLDDVHAADDRGRAHEHDGRRSSTQGTGNAAQIDGIEVAGKTGTAETDRRRDTHTRGSSPSRRRTRRGTRSR